MMKRDFEDLIKIRRIYGKHITGRQKKGVG